MSSQLSYLKSAEIELESEEGKRAYSNAFSQVFQSKQAFDKQFKVIIIGDSNTGKTALLKRVGEGIPFSSQSNDPTIGVDCKSKTFLHDNDLKVRL